MGFKKGYKMSEEHKRKIGKANKGRKPSKLCLERSREVKTGSIPWNKGLKTGIEPWNKGKTGTFKHTDEWKEEHSKRMSGEGHPLYGRHHSEKTIKKMSDTQSKKVGELAPRWRGGIDRTNEELRHLKNMKLWRKSVLERDRYTCQKCSQIGGELVVHHLLNFAEYENLRSDINNGVVLCRECHDVFHKRFGYTNNTEDQLTLFTEYE